ncbi:MAG: hypothetical protein EP343_02525 [Deltaproteobacteria bacterium]|nr:MAG: hypothetical protein EP343_02525 [Deltaproteobacteria bacterium]
MNQMGWLLATQMSQESQWDVWIWPIAIGLAAALVFSVTMRWWHAQEARITPILYVLEQILWNFRHPLMLVVIGSTTIVLLGLVAGSTVSLVLFVSLSTLTVVGLGFLGYVFWPKNKEAAGNLFDLIAVPPVVWPAYESEADRRMRDWAEQRAHELKTNPPEFHGVHFGTIALETSQEAAAIYGKQTPLSVSLVELSRGLERTAADMKILTNHLPLSGHFTLAAIEREIDYTVENGRFLYVSLFALLSIVNPGNLLRVLLAFVQQKSPWEHLFREMQGWVYSHYSLRLGYHMSLIHSRRKPPPAYALQVTMEQCETQARDEQLRRQKVGWLALMGLLGFFAYILLQLTNAALVFGKTVLIIELVLFAGILVGFWGLRSTRRWSKLWASLMPQWPEKEPTWSSKEEAAEKQLNGVLYKHREPPHIQKMEDIRKLPPHYGDLLLEVWKACYTPYRPSEETLPVRTTREFYLPQGFAGVEVFFRSIRKWVESDALLARTLRQMEQFGLDLEALYLYLQNSGNQDEKPSQAPPKEQPEPPAQDDPARQSGSFWDVAKWVGKRLGGVVKDFAVGRLHQLVMERIEQDFGRRLIDIYGARYPRIMFEPEPAPEAQHILVLSRESEPSQRLLQALVPDGVTPSQEEDESNIPEPWSVTWELDTNHTYILERWNWSEAELEQHGLPEGLEQRLKEQSFAGVLLVDIIDYGARERIARLMRENLLPQLRESEVGGLALVLMGVEKVKPLTWSPPYDDYLEAEPEQKKSSRIRSAVLAWEEAIAAEHRLSFSSIYPVGIPQEGEAWGLKRLQAFLRPLKTKAPNPS